jgi:hypothetical protein
MVETKGHETASGRLTSPGAEALVAGCAAFCGVLFARLRRGALPSRGVVWRA